MKALCKEPLLHFLLLGGLLFAFNAWRESSRRVPDSGNPEIHVTAGIIQRLQAGHERRFNQAPDEETLRGLVAAHIREEILFREALALGLDRDDSIVRQRLAQKMEFLTADITAAAEPAPDALESFFRTNQARYARPARVTFRHVYFSRERRGAGLESATRAALAELNAGAAEERMGDAFLHGHEFAATSPEDIGALFGPTFASELAGCPVQRWHGPVASSYGLHLVRLESRAESGPVALPDVRATVVRDFNEARRREANEQVFARLKARYRIQVDDEAILRATSTQTARLTR